MLLYLQSTESACMHHASLPYRFAGEWVDIEVALRSRWMTKRVWESCIRQSPGGAQSWLAGAIQVKFETKLHPLPDKQWLQWKMHILEHKLAIVTTTLTA